MTMNRRSLLKATTAGIAAAATGNVAAKPDDLGRQRLPGEPTAKVFGTVDQRARSAYTRRVRAAGIHLIEEVGLPPQPVNGDEMNLPGFIGNFSKTLPHDALGEVDPAAYLALVNAIQTNDYSGVILSPEAHRRLANPSASETFEIHGTDAHSTRINAAPAFHSDESAAEMIELYWQALTRDVPFDRYQGSSDIASAAVDITTATFPLGPRENGQVTPNTIFRGSTPGDLTGPYLSQLLLQPISYGAGVIEQRYLQPVPGNDFMDDFAEYLAIQRGQNPVRSDIFEDTPRYIQTNRDLANYVHNDVLFQAYYNAGIILLSMGSAALADENPFNDDAVEGGFVTFGGPDVLNMVAQAARMALTGAWFQKWTQRKLRSEGYGARVDVQRRGLADYVVPVELLASEGYAQTVARQGNALLAQAFPEGSPTHPAYPAGHACVAGACATILKAWFREDFPFPDPKLVSDDGLALTDYTGPELSVGGEINKLANNIAIGRNAAGVHYRSDGEQGILAGEQQAIGLLQDYSLAYARQFNGFTLRKFDGTSVNIADGQVTVL